MLPFLTHIVFGFLTTTMLAISSLSLLPYVTLQLTFSGEASRHTASKPPFLKDTCMDDDLFAPFLFVSFAAGCVNCVFILLCALLSMLSNHERFYQAHQRFNLRFMPVYMLGTALASVPHLIWGAVLLTNLHCKRHLLFAGSLVVEGTVGAWFLYYFRWKPDLSPKLLRSSVNTDV